MLFVFSIQLCYPYAVALFSFGCLTLPPHDPSYLCQNKTAPLCFCQSSVERRIPVDRMEEQPRVVVWNRLLQNVLLHRVALEGVSRNFHFDLLEAG